MKILITSEYKGKRLDIVLKDFLKESRHQAALLIKSGAITVNGKSSKAHYLTKKGDSIERKWGKKEISKNTKKNIPLDIIYEDEYVLAVNKPAGLLVHPAGNTQEGTLIEGMEARGFHPYLVHRLDRDTSGVILIAKDPKTQQWIQEQFAKRKIKKCYLALIRGHIEPQEGSIEAPLTRREKHRTLIRVSAGKKARYALTHYKVKKYFEDSQGKYSLLEVQIVTGRTHQIRVHFKSIGYPLVGDAQYGNAKLNKYFAQKYGLKRQFLHAKTIEFQHPLLKKLVKLEAESPSILTKVIKKLKPPHSPRPSNHTA